MLNYNPSSEMLSVKISEVFLEVKQQEFTIPATGRIFTSNDFAKGWNTIYVKPSQLSNGEVVKGMRKISEPTLVMTSHKNQMAFVLASENEPVFIPGNFKRTKEEGFTIAFRLTPYIIPEFVYYMCIYDTWSNIINGIDAYSNYMEDGWQSVGTYLGDGFGGFFITPEHVIRVSGNITLPSIEQQKVLVNAGAQQRNRLNDFQKADRQEISEIINRYLISGVESGFSLLKLGRKSIALLGQVYQVAAGLKMDAKVIKILEDNNYIYKDVLERSELEALASNLEVTFDELVKPSEFLWTSSSTNLQPQEVTDFMIKLADIPNGVKVYNPFSGLSSFAIALNNNYVVGEEADPVTWALSQIRLFGKGVSADISLRKPLEHLGASEEYQTIISSPSYLKQKGEEIHDVVSVLYDKLAAGGTLVTLVPQSFLFSRSKAVSSVRSRLVNEKAIRGIFTLPANIFPGTGISQAVMVITKGKENERIIFGDASDYTRFKKSVYRMTTFEADQFLKDMEEEIEDYFERGEYIDDTTIAVPIPYSEIFVMNLVPANYLVERPEDGIPLSDIAEVVSGDRAQAGGKVQYFITASSIPAAMHRMPYVPKPVSNENVSTAKTKTLLPKDAVIIALTPNGVRSVYTKDFEKIIAYPSNVVMILQPKEGVSAKYLAALISSKIVSNQFKAQISGSVIGNLNRVRLQNIFVPANDSSESQERFISQILSEEMDESEKMAVKESLRRERELKSTRHAMGQTLVALTANWEQLLTYADINNGIIDLSETIGNINPIPVKDVMSSIGYAITTLGHQVDSLKLEKYDWGLDTEINPYKFINNYIATHSTPSIRMVNVGGSNECDYPWYDEESGKGGYEHTDSEFIFYAPERMLERIFNNIVANAKAHGFTDENQKDCQIRFDWTSEDGNVVITIANNGAPLKENVSSDDVLMLGYSTSLNEMTADGTLHSGYGGHEIKALMEGLGNVQVLSFPGEEFPVVYRLVFEKTNFETIDLDF